MGRALSAEQVKKYRDDGVLFPIRVLSDQEVGEFRSALDELESTVGTGVRRIDYSHLFFKWAYDLATHRRLLDVMEDLLGPSLLVMSSRVFYKHPRDGSFASWHQDGNYLGLSSVTTPSIWIALSDSTPENGCVRVIPRSHLAGILPHRETESDKNILNHGQEIASEVLESSAIDLVLRPGEMSIHNPSLIHGSGPNLSDTCRIGFSVTFSTPEVTRALLPVVRARGALDWNEFTVWGEPPELSIKEALAAHERFTVEGGWPRMQVA